MKSKSKFSMLATAALWWGAIPATLDSLLAVQYEPSKALFNLWAQTAVTKNTISIWLAFKRGLLMSCYLPWTLWNKIVMPLSTQEGSGVYGELPQDVKLSLIVFTHLMVTSCFFTRSWWSGAAITHEKGNRRKWETEKLRNSETVLMHARQFFCAAAAEYFWGSTQNWTFQIRNGGIQGENQDCSLKRLRLQNEILMMRY